MRYVRKKTPLLQLTFRGNERFNIANTGSRKHAVNSSPLAPRRDRCKQRAGFKRVTSSIR